MKTFNTFLTEFPHLTLQSGRFIIDFEFEMKSDWSLEQVKDYFNQLLSGKKIATKNPNYTFSIPIEYSAELAKKMLVFPYIQNWVINKWGDTGWAELNEVIHEYI